MIGIYKIENKITNEVYIGQSRDIQARWMSHRRNAIAKDKVRKYALYRDIRRYGFEAFDFSVLEECTQFQLNDKENYWIEYYSHITHMYNISYPKGVERR